MKSSPKPAPSLSMGAQLKNVAAALNTLPARNRQATPKDRAQPKRKRLILSVPLYKDDFAKVEKLTLALMRAGFRKNEALAMQTAIQRMKISPALLKGLATTDTGAAEKKNFSVQQPELDHLATVVTYLYKNSKNATHAEAARLALRQAEPDEKFLALAADLQERYDHRRRAQGARVVG